MILLSCYTKKSINIKGILVAKLHFFQIHMFVYQFQSVIDFNRQKICLETVKFF